MKTQILILSSFMACMLSILSCDQKKVQNGSPQDSDNQESQVSDPAGDDTPRKEVYQVAGYQKTACYGNCPVYQVRFYSDGTVSWNGKLNVDRMGTWQAKVDDQVLRDIREEAFKAAFFDLNNEYPVNEKIPDLPSTITYIRVGDMEKTIRHTADAPDNLRSFEQYLEGVISNCRWHQ